MRRRGALVIDFGAQYGQLIARRIREAEVWSELVPPTITPDRIRALNPAALVLSGGPASVHASGAVTIDPAIYELGIPVLGICYGCQLIAHQLGGTVERGGRGEYGRTALERLVETPSALLAADTVGDVWMSHFDAVTVAPNGFVTTARTSASPHAVIENRARRIWGVQFHPEVAHTEGGQAMLERFLHECAGIGRDWTPSSVVDEQVDAVRAQVGGGRAVCGLSGGVDSAVAAVMVHRAIGDRLTCVYVDTGLMREGESDSVVAAFRRSRGMDLVQVDAGSRFFARLAGVVDPEQKRKAIGELFVRVFEEQTREIDGAGFLVQGTLYPDVVESGGNGASTIKSHHNVGGLPDDMSLELVEPLRHLFKDEVRRIGASLGLPDDIVMRQPFPGPGLAVRVLGEVTPERVATVCRADSIVREEIERAGLDRGVWQAFAVLIDSRSVGVMGDVRTYGNPVVIRAVTSDDAMTADWARLPHDLLDAMSNRIVNEVPGVNRVVYDVTSKPPGTIEWE